MFLRCHLHEATLFFKLSKTQVLDYADFMANGTGPDLDEPYWQEKFWERIQDFYNIVELMHLQLDK